MKKIATLFSIALIMSLAPTASANSPLYTNFSDPDLVYPSGLSSAHRLSSLSVSVMQSDPAEVIFRAGITATVSNSIFVSSTLKPQLRIIITDLPFTTREDWGMVTIETPLNVFFQGTSRIDAVATSYVNPALKQAGGRKSLAECRPRMWIESGFPTSFITFSIDRVCADIPNLFFAHGYIDSDISNTPFANDWKFSPPNPLSVDMRTVPRPLKNQTVSFGGGIPTQNLDNPKVTARLTSSMGLPVTLISQTPAVCTATLTGLDLQVNLLSQGTCSLEAFALGSVGVNPSPRVVQSFTVNPKVMIRQDLSWNEPSDVMVGDDPFSVDIFTSSGLPLQASSNSPNVCRFSDPSSPLFITIVGSGTCSISVRAEATDKYFSASGTASFEVAPKPVVPKPKPPANEPSSSTRATKPTPPLKVFGGGSTSTDKQTTVDVQRDTAKTNTKASKKNITITCAKGAITRKVTAPNPKCPPGFKKQ